MIKIQVPIFTEVFLPKLKTRYDFSGYKNISIKNKPNFRDVNKITKLLPGIPMGSIGQTPLQTLLETGKMEVCSFYDARQNSRRFKNYYITTV